MRLGYKNVEELRLGFPEFFYEQVYPYISEGLGFLRKTQEGEQWIANLFLHVHEQQARGDRASVIAESENPADDSAEPIKARTGASKTPDGGGKRPKIAISNP